MAPTPTTKPAERSKRVLKPVRLRQEYLQTAASALAETSSTGTTDNPMAKVASSPAPKRKAHPWDMPIPDGTGHEEQGSSRPSFPANCELEISSEGTASLMSCIPRHTDLFVCC